MSYAGTLIIQPLWKNATKDNPQPWKMPVVFQQITHFMSSEYVGSTSGPQARSEQNFDLNLLSTTQMQKSVVEFTVDSEKEPDAMKKLADLWKPALDCPVARGLACFPTQSNKKKQKAFYPDSQCYSASMLKVGASVWG